MQVDIYDALDKDYDNIAGFGRVYRIPTEKGMVPHRFILGSKQDYEGVYLDDSKDISFFFIDGETHDTNDGIVYTAPVKICFWINLSKIGTGFRADADAHRLISGILKNDVYTEFKVNGLEKGVDNVFRGFYTKDIMKSDMQPYHLFAFSIDLPYYLTQKC